MSEQSRQQAGHVPEALRRHVETKCGYDQTTIGRTA